MERRLPDAFVIYLMLPQQSRSLTILLINVNSSPKESEPFYLTVWSPNLYKNNNRRNPSSKLLYALYLKLFCRRRRFFFTLLSRVACAFDICYRLQKRSEGFFFRLGVKGVVCRYHTSVLFEKIKKIKWAFIYFFLHMYTDRSHFVNYLVGWSDVHRIF